ncbi:hypothetical protein D3C80_1910100 [compost metagenome]
MRLRAVLRQRTGDVERGAAEAEAARGQLVPEHAAVVAFLFRGPGLRRHVVVGCIGGSVDLGEVLGELVVLVRFRIAGVVAPALQPPFELDRPRRTGIEAR